MEGAAEQNPAGEEHRATDVFGPGGGDHKTDGGDGRPKHKKPPFHGTCR